MSRGKLLATTIYTAFCLLCLAYAGWILIRSLEREEPGRTRRFPLPTYPEDRPEEAIEEVVEVPAPRDLAIEGRVVAADLSPFANPPGRRGTVTIGDEEVEVAADGTFRFPPRLRDRLVPFLFSAEGAGRVEFQGLVAGDARPEPEAEPEPSDGEEVLEEEVFATELPERPARLRWTLILPPAPRPAKDRFWILPGDVLIEEWGRGARVHVRGESSLPEGAHVYATLNFDDYRVASSFRPGTVTEGEWLAVIPVPAKNRLFSGEYELEASFNLLLEHAEMLQSWPEDVSDALQTGGGGVSSVRRVFIGDPVEARAEDLAVQEYYGPLLAETRRLHRELLTRVKNIQRLGKGWDPALLEAHRKAHGDAWFLESFIDGEGMLDERRWREFLDGRWRPRVELLLDTHLLEENPKYVEAQSRMKSVLESLLSLSRLYSGLSVYGLFNLPIHEKDFYAFEEGQADISLLEHRLAEDFLRLERFTELVKSAGDGAR